MRHLITGIAVTTALVSVACDPPRMDPDAAVPAVDAPFADAPRSDTGAQPDAFLRADAFMMMGEDAPMMMGDDAGMMTTDDAGMMMMGDDAAMMMMGDDAAMAMGDSGPMGDAGPMGLANDTCETATLVGAGMTTGTSAGAIGHYGVGTNCAGEDGVDVVYAIDVPAGQRVAVTVSSGDMMFDPSISLVAGPASNCGATPRVCLDGDDSGGATTANTAVWVNDTGATARVFAVVDSFDDTDPGGAFTLDVAFTTPTAGDLCGTAISLAAGTVMGTTVGAANDYGSGTGCSGTAGADTVYAISVPAGQRANVTVTSADGTFNPSISLVAGPAATCGGSPRTCLSSDDTGGPTAMNRASWANAGASATTIYAVVDTGMAMATGMFSITLALDTPPAGDVCASATPLAAGTVMGTTAGATNDYGTGTSCAGVGGADVAYSISVPAGQRAVVTVTSGDGTFDPSISLVNASCGGSPRTCLAGDDSGAATAVNRAAWINTTGATATIFAIVDTGSAAATGMFTLTLAFETPPAGDQCGTAVRVTPGATMATTMGYANDYGGGAMCAGTAGADRVYVISVPAGQTLNADVTSGDGTFDPSISLEVACGATPRVCVDGDDTGAATAVNMVTHTNSSGAAQDVFIVIDSFSGTATGMFTMNVALVP